jgi:hypothetical protein
MRSGRAMFGISPAAGVIPSRGLDQASATSGHYIRNTGSGILRLLLGFNNGHYHSYDLNAWLASNPPDVLATNLGLPRTVAEGLHAEGIHKETLFIARPPSVVREVN